MKLQKMFNILQKVLLIVFFLLVVIGSVFVITNYGINQSKYVNILIIYGIFTLLSIVILSLKFDNKKKIYLLFLIGLILRIVWVILIPTKLVSDYKTIYEIAFKFLQGNNEGIIGYSYLGRFPHLIPTMLYVSCIISIFPTTNLLTIKIVNIILSMITMFLIMKLSKFFMEKEESNVIVLTLSAINVTFISFISTFCTENIAIPLFLFTILVFLKTLKFQKKQFIGIIFTGVMLSISNLFRAVGVIFVIAFVLYMFFYTDKNKLKNIVILVLSYLIMNALISSLLIGSGIIDKPLWIGSEPKVTSVLKGTNILNYGMWNEDDANFITNNLENPELKQMCIDKIKERITSLSIPEFIMFYGGKLIMQWSVADSGGVFWATYDLPNNINRLDLFQIIGIIYMLLSFLSLFRNNKDEMRLLHILLIGIISLFAIIEAQSRYSYIISWVYIFMAAKEIEYVIQKIKDKKIYLLNEKNK